MPEGHELIFRTEDISLEDILHLFVETSADRRLVDACKTKASVVLQGSRGVGKSFILRVAQAEMESDFAASGVLPVYVTFNKAGLLQTSDQAQFQHWMMAKICNRIVRSVKQKGLLQGRDSVISSLAGGATTAGDPVEDILAQLETKYEDSWRTPGAAVDARSLEPQRLIDALEDICTGSALRRVVLLVDEAAHVFIPEQQRQFFTLMRDLRSPQLSVKAAIYPGVTSFGDSFQMSHDATLLSVDRDILDPGYLSAMREIVQKQDPTLGANITRQGGVFDSLAFAATGNPRILLKTLTMSLPLNSNNVQRTMREYFREAIWSEHSALGDRYHGHRLLIDWGRDFIENSVIPGLLERNERNQEGDQALALWIHRDAPAAVKEGLRLLCYSGILQEAGSGLKATRSGTGSRFVVNVGCALSQLGTDMTAYATRLRQQASIKRMIEFGPNHPLYKALDGFNLAALEDAEGSVIELQLQRSIDDLDLTVFLRGKLTDLGFTTIGSVLNADETDFRSAHMVGPARSRQMMNAATAAVLEYISG